MKANNLLDKLERVERSINIYNSDTDELVEEIKIDLPLDTIKQIVSPKEDDPKMYLGYNLDERQLLLFNEKLGGAIKINLEMYDYFLDCQGIYNW